MPYTRDSDFVADIAAAGPDVVVLEPAELRDQVLAQLRAVLEVSHDRS